MRVANYQSAMAAYHRQLWNKVLSVLQIAPEDAKTSALSTHLEASTLAKQQHIATHHIAGAASKAMASAISFSAIGPSSPKTTGC